MVSNDDIFIDHFEIEPVNDWKLLQGMAQIMSFLGLATTMEDLWKDFLH